MTFALMKSFSAKIYIIGINPYVLLPEEILQWIFAKAGKDKGHIPVKLVINNKAFIQTLIKYSGKWRLYLNGPMRKTAGKDVGDIILIKIDHDAADRTIPAHTGLDAALK